MSEVTFSYLTDVRGESFFRTYMCKMAATNRLLISQMVYNSDSVTLVDV